MLHRKQFVLFCVLLTGTFAATFAQPPAGAIARPASAAITVGALSVDAFDDGSYALRTSLLGAPVLRAGIEADLTGLNLKSAFYPHHKSEVAEFHDELGAGRILTVTHTGLPETPDLICRLRLYNNLPWGDIQVTVVNATTRSIEVHAIRAVQAQGDAVVALGGPEMADRVLSDSFSEDGPQLRLKDLAQPIGDMHRAVGSQLIYNRESHASLF